MKTKKRTFNKVGKVLDEVVDSLERESQIILFQKALSLQEEMILLFPTAISMLNIKFNRII